MKVLNEIIKGIERGFQVSCEIGLEEYVFYGHDNEEGEGKLYGKKRLTRCKDWYEGRWRAAVIKVRFFDEEKAQIKHIKFEKKKCDEFKLNYS